MRLFPVLLFGVASALGLSVVSCKTRAPAAVVSEGDTFAELRAVKGEISVAPPGESKRVPYPRERIAAGEEVTLAAGALAWIRRDGGAVWLVEGPAVMTLRPDSVKLGSGRAFVDADDGPPVSIETPSGTVELSDARASVDVTAGGDAQVYVLRGSARAGTPDRATAGEQLTLSHDHKVTRAAAVAWDDWTGGLATADPAAAPPPFGLGTVGARPPGNKGTPRFSLVVERLDVHVTVDHDLAVTEVDQTFVNPSPDVVEGIFSFRTPPGAVLSKFGVDREGQLVWGKVKESAAAKAQYESNVYEGSTEDPALLAWQGPGVYSARLYPIPAGAKRRVVTRYAEWLSRQGARADRRMYVYPMAAEGARGSLPRIEELRVSLDLTKAGADRVRVGMGGKQQGKEVVIQAFDFVPRADLAVELFDGGESTPVAYRAPHALTAEDIPMNADSSFAAKVSAEEPDYLLVPLRSSSAGPEAAKGMDLAIVIDTSAATEPGALAVARSLTSALLSHLGPDDRAALWAGDATLRPVWDGSGALVRVDAEKRRQWLAGLATVDRGGATDLGALLTEAAGRLDPARRGAVLYIGDGLPSVGEISSKSLRDRLTRLPAGTRLLTAGVGSRANIALLDSIARGGPVESVGDAYGAARAALRLLEAAQRPAWVGATVDLGSGVERVLPRELPAVGADESVLVVGRVSGKAPRDVKLAAAGSTSTRSLRIVTIEDGGDLRRRWGQGRMEELLGEGAQRASLVDIGRRYGLVSPYTSLYVPTAREAAQQGGQTDEEIARARAEAIDRRRRWRPWVREFNELELREPEMQAAAAESKEGGTGTRAKGEEGSMGNPNRPSGGSSPGSGTRYGVRGPSDNPDPAQAPAAALANASEFGTIGILPSKEDRPPPPPGPQRDEEVASARGNMWGDNIGDSFGAGGLGLSAVGEGGGGRGEGIGIGSVGTLGHGSGTGTGQGFGSGAADKSVARPKRAPSAPMGAAAPAEQAQGGRLGGEHMTSPPSLRQGAINVVGRLPQEVIQRIVRQNFGRFRLCYENGLRSNPDLAGRVTVRFVIARDGSVTNAADGGSEMPDSTVVGCVARGFQNLSFPQPEGGIVTVTYPILFEPGEGSTPSAATRPTSAPATPLASAKGLAVIGHTPRPCGAAAELPLPERRILWGERLAQRATAAWATQVYRRALEDCEAPSWRERTTLLLQMVESIPSVTERVALWKSLILTPAADVVYRAIIVRVQSVAQLHELHKALGLAVVDPDLLAGMVAKAKTPAERLSVLRAAATRWPDDLELGLRVLDAYEDAGDDPGGRAWARRLRRRADATAHVWTSVGEHYLRLASREKGADAERDATEARRTFGELVEFSPEDPAARRRLGDLLRAHGWYEEAFRQYLTLQQLTPDDPAVPLLLAAATQGMGRVEEAVGWAEKAAAAGSPDGASMLSRSARATASAFLAWARDEALRTGKAEDAEKLLVRARRLAAAQPTKAGPGDVRLIVTWSHPELHPSLWTSTLGTLMPSPDNFPVFGVAEARLPAAGVTTVELRLDPEDASRAARLGLKAVVTAITAEGLPEEKVARSEVGFGSVAAPVARTVVTHDSGVLRAGDR